MEPIAIIGLSFRLPQGAEDESSLWDVLENGRNLMTPWPESRANIDAFYCDDATRINKLSSKGGHFLKSDPGAFDAPFFSITAKEAASMDPQQRWLMETSYRALENAGIPVEQVAGSDTAVFSSSMAEDFMRIVSKDPDQAPMNTPTGTTPCMLANRLSWYFDLTGPSIQVNTACSSSMIAMDLACRSLQSGQSSMALVTGCNVLLSPETSMYLSNMNFLSPDSVCHSFDERANGYARGEGVVVLVIKRLSDAIRAGELVSAQERLIRQVYASCNLDFKLTRYVEAHGTGTQIGDITETKALGRVFKKSRSRKEPLYIASIKANIGHLEGCSGLAGIVKCIMVLERGIIPPNALTEKVNPKINAASYNIQIPTSSVQWPTDGLRRVSVNSFGLGGSNGHIIMDDAFHTLEILSRNENWHMLHSSESSNSGREGLTRTQLVPLSSSTVDCKDSFSRSSNSSSSELAELTAVSSIETSPGAESDSPKHQLLIWSAKDEDSLKRVQQQHEAYYNSHIRGSPHAVSQLAYTLAERRSLMAWRSFAVVDKSASTSALSLGAVKGMRSSRNTGLAFVFTGQGAQYAQMGVGLLCYPAFLAKLEEANHVFQSLGADWSLIDVLRNETDITPPQLSQPICTALQIALIALLETFSIRPRAVIGHSSGEIAAAYACGALALASACKIAFYRGQLAEKLIASTKTPGAMMSVNIPEAGVQSYLSEAKTNGDISIACVNSPYNVTLSGDKAAIDSLKKHLDKDNIFAHELNTGVAYHSPAMREIADEYLGCLEDLTRGRSHHNDTLMVSSVTGLKTNADMLCQPQYWVDNLVSPVRFTDALQYIVSAAPRADGMKPITHFIEVGPHSALQRSIKDTTTQVTGGKEFRYLPTLHKQVPSVESMLGLVGQLFVDGHSVSIQAANSPNPPKPTLQPLANMPEYPFDHSQIFWHESRLSRDWRLRGSVPPSLLGSRVADWNPLEPRWRKFLGVDEYPWVVDHVIGEEIFFPATGMLMMALEAVTQCLVSRPEGYRVKEASFMQPIILREDADVEAITQCRNLQRAHEKASSRFEVQIFTCSAADSSWRECFKAVIHAELKDTSMHGDGGFEARAAAEKFVSDYEKARLASTSNIAKDKFYRFMDSQGLKYGPTFSLATAIAWDNQDVCTAHIGTLKAGTFQGIVHPGILDACCQIAATAPSKGVSKPLSTMVPHIMKDAWISANGWQDADQLRVLSDSRLKPNETGIDCTITATTPDGVAEDKGQRKTHTINWQPQLSLLTTEQLHDQCKVDQFSDDDKDVVESYLELERTLYDVMRREIGGLRETDWSTAPVGMEQYVSWMDMQLQSASVSLGSPEGPEDLDRRLQDLVNKRPSWKLFNEVSRNIARLVRGEISAEDIQASSLVQDFYDAAFDTTSQGKISSYLRLAAHQTPNQRIVEFGFGQCNMTEHVLSALQQIEDETGGIAFTQYTYNDVSMHSNSVCEAPARFAQYKDRLQFQSLRHGKDQEVVGSLGTKEYDLIVVNNFWSMTRNPRVLIKKLGNALKTGGHLILREFVQPPSIAVNFGLGILPNWWSDANEKLCPHTCGPVYSESEWCEILRENGFSGLDMVIRDRKETDARYASIVVSTQVVDESRKGVTGPRESLLLVIDNENDELQKSMAACFKDMNRILKNGEAKIVIISQIAEIEVRTDDTVIWLADIGKSLLADMTASSFQLIQSWILRSTNLLWVTGTPKPETNTIGSLLEPYHGLKDGFLRSLRAELVNKRIVSLTLEDTSMHTVTRNAQHVFNIFTTAFESQSTELEYVIRDGTITTGRLVEGTVMNKALQDSLHPQMKTRSWLSSPPVMLSIGSRGSLETLHFKEDTDSAAPLGVTEIEIDARAWGVNFRDVFIALGRLEEADLGSDCAGVVTRVGAECTSVRPGDRVYMGAMGCMRARPRADQTSVVKIADSISFETACGIVGPAMTAWHSLMEVGRLRKGDKVLIHAASGATGQLAIQVAQLVGAEIFATVGYDFKKKLLVEKYNIPVDHIFYSRNTSFAAGIKRMTSGVGVDLVLNSLAGESLMASWDCVAPYGRFVEIGKADIYANSSLPMSVDLRHMMLHNRDMARELLLKTMDLAESGKIRCPDPLHVYGINEVEDAFRYVQNGKNAGRTVIRIDGTVQVQKLIIDRIYSRFEEDASYLVAGGLGGIGRSILRWMATRNAKYLIVPSRSGGSGSEKAQQLVAELRLKGVTIITPQCDVSSESSLSDLLAQCSQTMPPIRGCINAAMALQDSVFENMRHQQWQGAIRSKVQTSWNLHALLPRDLDFFIMLSSNAGILGNMGQANYAAGCTFQDALAAHRNSSPLYSGKTALSVDLGVMGSIGVIAESETLQKRFDESQGHAQIEEDEFLSLLDLCCSPTQPLLSHSQLTVGLVTPADLFHRQLEPAEALHRPLMAHFSQPRTGIAAQHLGDGESPAMLFELATSAEEKAVVVIEALAKKLARALGIKPEDVDTDKPLHAFGVDSLVAVELHNWMSKNFSVQVPVRDIVGGKTVKFVGELVVEMKSSKS
ncbi:polyketide synthase PksD [Astrocystis sublimbata]|nr:polyketide synthase PksD [Astrocystis sublimbata]